MAIRKINSRSIQDGQIATADLADDAITAGEIADSVTLGVGFFQGENGSRGDTSSGKGDIFRVNESTLNTSVCLLYTSPSPRDGTSSRMPSSA